MNYKNRQELEEYFAENFHSELFPILSEHYLLDGDLDRAERVCDIGLRLNEHSILGLFLKSRILMAKKDFISAEQFLKKIILADSGFLNALLLMLDVQSKLNKSKGIKKHLDYKKRKNKRDYREYKKKEKYNKKRVVVPVNKLLRVKKL